MAASIGLTSTSTTTTLGSSIVSGGITGFALAENSQTISYLSYINRKNPGHTDGVLNPMSKYHVSNWLPKNTIYKGKNYARITE